MYVMSHNIYLVDFSGRIFKNVSKMLKVDQSHSKEAIPAVDKTTLLQIMKSEKRLKTRCVPIPNFSIFIQELENEILLMKKLIVSESICVPKCTVIFIQDLNGSKFVRLGWSQVKRERDGPPLSILKS